MENKLQQLTQKLYEEGLSKGRSDADKLVADAKDEAGKILADAREQADSIVSGARRQAEELRKNAMTELTLAGRQAVAALKENIANMILARTVSGTVHEAALDPQFVKELLLTVASHWNGASAGRIELKALLPAQWQEKFSDLFERDAKNLLSEGIEVGWSDSVKNGFRIGEKDGGYYISFSDVDFDALLGEFLREKVSKILYAE